MGKQLLPVPVRILAPSVVVDGVLFAEEGDFWQVWRQSPTGAYRGRRVYDATVYPMHLGATPTTSRVVAVNESDIVLVAILEPDAAAIATARTKNFKVATSVTVISQSVSVSGMLRSTEEVLVADQKPLEFGLAADMMTDVTIRSLDPAYPFEWAAPFAVLPERGKPVLLRHG